MYCYCIVGRVEDIQRSQLPSSSLQIECNSVLRDLAQLSSILHHYVECYSDKAIEIEDTSSRPDSIIQCPVRQNGVRGRPAYVVSKVQLETLIELGYNYSTIARMFGVSERTILRRRLEYDLPIGITFTRITDNDLDTAVSSMLRVCTNNYNLKIPPPPPKHTLTQSM